MKYIIVSALGFLTFYSCLLAPIPAKEDPAPAGYGNVTAGGDMKKRLDMSLKALSSLTGNPTGLFVADSTSDVAQRVGDALLGFTLLSAATGSQATAADKIFALLPENFNERGYLGEILHLNADERQLAGHAILIKALCEYYRIRGESGALDVAQRICDSLFVPVIDLLGQYPSPEVARINVYFESADSLGADTSALPVIGTGAPVRAGNWTLAPQYGEIFTAIDPLTQLYGYRRDEGTYQALDRLISMFTDVSEDFPGKGSSAYLSAIRGLLAYSRTVSDDDPRHLARKAWQAFTESSLTEMYGARRITPEGYGIVCPEDASLAYIVAMKLWEATGDGDYLQQAERIFYNSVAPSQLYDGRFTCLLSDTLDGKLSRYSGEGYGGIAAWVEALPAAVEFSWMLRGNKVLIPLYREGMLELQEGSIRIVQRTGYPLDSTVRLIVENAPRRGIGLQLYFPSYMTARSITRNGSQQLYGTVNSIGLLEMREIYRKGDTLDFVFKYAPKWVSSQSGATADSDLYKPSLGPLLLGYRSDQMLWLERGVQLRPNGKNFETDPEFNYVVDSLSGKTMVETQGDRQISQVPVFRPIYTPVEEYGSGDILPEYFLVRIGRE